MKHVPLVVFLVLVVAACNLTNKFKSGSSNSNSNSTASSGNPSKIGDEPVEKAAPTAAQIAALANGQEAKWDQQGITWTLPPNWKKEEVRNETLSYGGNGAFLSVNISTMSPDFPSDISIKATHEAAKTQQKIGKYDEVKWLELDGVRGVEFRESKQETPGDIRRLEWQATSAFFDGGKLPACAAAHSLHRYSLIAYEQYSP